jgi:hypothetical protein
MAAAAAAAATKETYIEKVKEYAQLLKDDSESEGFPVTKKLISEINKAGLDYFGEKEYYNIGPRAGEYKSGYMALSEDYESEDSLYNSSVGFENMDDNFIVLNESDFQTKRREETGNDEPTNYAWFSDAIGFSLLIDISDPESPKYYKHPKLKFGKGDDTLLYWKRNPGGLSIEEIPELSADAHIIGITVEQEGMNMIWFPIPSPMVGGNGRRRRKKTRRQNKKKSIRRTKRHYK